MSRSECCNDDDGDDDDAAADDDDDEQQPTCIVHVSNEVSMCNACIAGGLSDRSHATTGPCFMLRPNCLARVFWDLIAETEQESVSLETRIPARMMIFDKAKTRGPTHAFLPSACARTVQFKTFRAYTTHALTGYTGFHFYMCTVLLFYWTLSWQKCGVILTEPMLPTNLQGNGGPSRSANLTVCSSDATRSAIGELINWILQGEDCLLRAFGWNLMFE
eukprot:4457427-Amphidinium_carterae.1